MEIGSNVTVQYPQQCKVRVSPRICHKLEDHQLEANEKEGGLISGSEDDTESPIENS